MPNEFTREALSEADLIDPRFVAEDPADLPAKAHALLEGAWPPGRSRSSLAEVSTSSATRLCSARSSALMAVRSQAIGASSFIAWAVPFTGRVSANYWRGPDLFE